MASLNPYAKFHETDEVRLLHLDRQKNRRKTIIGICAIIFVCCIVATVVRISVSQQAKKPQFTSSNVKAICDVTLYPESCYSSLAPLANSTHSRPQDLFRLSVQVAINEILNVSKQFNQVRGLNIADKNALENCQVLFSLALNHLNDSVLTPKDFTKPEAFDDLRTWLSSAGTYQQTCIDDLRNASLSGTASTILKNSTEFTSNSLAIISWIERLSIHVLGSSIGHRRRLMSTVTDPTPKWLSRKLMALDPNIVPNAIVAQDGSGKYKTIRDALRDAPDNSEQRYVIYVKQGIYVENVNVGTSKWNVMMIGDGMNATIVSGSLNFADGTPTFNTPTFSVFGKGFIGRDMGFVNTAGAPKQQAIALLSASDLSIFYRCRIDAFQDTLCTHTNRQFYRECDIYGTVDFIFGNAASVFQNCNIMPRKPMVGQQNIVTAQGKTDPNQNTGISIQNCTIVPFEELNGTSTYLGRPWKDYSTTIFLQNVIGGLVAPQGWLPWVGTSAAPDTIFYAEYNNSGPGSVTSGRVNWTGLKLNLTPTQANMFTARSLINADNWIPRTGVPYNSGL